jgi:hypothetical protein
MENRFSDGLNGERHSETINFLDERQIAKRSQIISVVTLGACRTLVVAADFQPMIVHSDRLKSQASTERLHNCRLRGKKILDYSSRI